MKIKVPRFESSEYRNSHKSTFSWLRRSRARRIIYNMNIYPGNNNQEDPSILDAAIIKMRSFCMKNAICLPDDYGDFLVSGYGGEVDDVNDDKAFDLMVDVTNLYGITNNPPNNNHINDIWKWHGNELPFQSVIFAESDVYFYYISVCDRNPGVYHLSIPAMSGLHKSHGSFTEWLKDYLSCREN